MHPQDMVMILMPEGPIAFDGKEYRYSKGERLYIDRLAESFKEVIIISFVLRRAILFMRAVYILLLSLKIYQLKNYLVRTIRKSVFFVSHFSFYFYFTEY